MASTFSFLPRVPVSAWRLLLGQVVLLGAGGCLAFRSPVAGSRRCSRIGIHPSHLRQRQLRPSQEVCDSGQALSWGFFFSAAATLCCSLCGPVAARLGGPSTTSPRAAAPHASSRALHPAPARIRCPCPVLTHCTHTLLCHTRPPTATRLILAPSRQVSAVRLCIFIPSFPFDWHVLLSNYVVANRRSQRVFIEADGCDSPVLVAVTTFPPSPHHTSRPP